MKAGVSFRLFVGLLVVAAFFTLGRIPVMAGDYVDCDAAMDLAQDRSQHTALRLQAVYSMRNCLNDVEPRQALVTLVKEDADIEIRKMGARILGWATWDGVVRDYLVEIADGHHPTEIRLEAIRALGHAHMSSDRDRLYDFIAKGVADSGDENIVQTAFVRSSYWAVYDQHETVQRALKDLVKDQSANQYTRAFALEVFEQNARRHAEWICPDDPEECIPRPPVYWSPPKLPQFFLPAGNVISK